MWLDLQRLQTEHRRPFDLQVALVRHEPGRAATNLPYYDQTLASRLEQATQAEPRRLWHFAAWLNSALVGHVILHLTTGPLGIAGIYNCGVVPTARNQGIGKAVTLAACRQALMLGCPHAVLNATPLGEPVFRALGFESIGYGQTWWLHRPVLAAPPPTTERIALAEAVGRSDLTTLDCLAPTITAAQLDQPLPAGMTLIQLAVKLNQPEAAQWLIDHGATLDLLSARDLGRHDQLPDLLKANPELANQRLDPGGVTPLHIAAWENDVALVRLLLDHGADATLEDYNFRATPLGWARHNSSVEAAEMIEAATLG
jgi:GNAT superfamily N-acetyltransferase